MNRSLFDNVTAHQSLKPALNTATGNGLGVSIADADAVTFLVSLNDWTDGGHIISFEESDDDSTYAAISTSLLKTNTAADLTSGTIVFSATTKEGRSYLVGYIGKKQYVRAVRTVSGSPSTGASYGVSVLKSNLRAVGNNPMNPAGPQWD